MTIDPSSTRFIVAGRTGAKPANVLTVRVSADNAAITASLATDELTTVMLEPVSTQKSYSLPFIRSRIVGVPTAVIVSGNTRGFSGKVITSSSAPANALPQCS